MIGCNYVMMPRATCAKLIALCCAVCLLAMSRSNRQYAIYDKKKNMRTETINEESEKTSTQQYTKYFINNFQARQP